MNNFILSERERKKWRKNQEKREKRGEEELRNNQ
jgi:hypothetical protein